MKKIITTLALALLIITILFEQVRADETIPTINKHKAVMEVDSILLLYIQGRVKEDTIWETSDANIVEILESDKSKIDYPYCRIQAMKAGIATITARTNHITYICRVTVIDSDDERNRGIVLLPVYVVQDMFSRLNTLGFPVELKLDQSKEALLVTN